MCTLPYSAAATEPSVLNIFLHSTPESSAKPDEQVTFQADVYSTSDTTEMLHVEARTNPLKKFALISIYQPDSLGDTTCVPTVLFISCDIPIARFHEVYISGVVDAPPLAGCNPSFSFEIRATLPNRATFESRTVKVDNLELCVYLPQLSK